MSKHRNPDRGKNRGRRDGRGRGDDRGGLQVLPGGPDGDGLLVAEGVEADVVALRADARALAAAEARRLRRVVAIAERCTRETRAFLALGGRVPGATSDTELVMSAVTCELMMALGISKSHAEGLQMLATRLVRVLPETLAMLEMGRLDLTRARLLAEATEILDDDHAREVQAPLLPALGAGPWDGPSPRAWRARVQRAVITVDPDSARRRRETAIRDRLVRAWAVGDGTGVIQIVGRDVDIAVADRVITDLAHAWPAVGPDGEALSMDQRRADAVMDLFRRVADGNDLPWMRTGREREVAIVIHADTFFGNGPGKDAPGEVRGLDAPAPIDPISAAQLARTQIQAGTPARVLLVDREGVLQRTIRLPEAPRGGWTRHLLEGSVRKAIPDLPPLQTENYEPTVAITDHVRAVHPGALRMTARGSRATATWITTRPTRVDRPASRICVPAAAATTSSKPEASCKHACAKTGPSPPPPCSGPPSRPDQSACPATAPARLTPPCTQPEAVAGTAAPRSRRCPLPRLTG